jgi:hypothetical protein
VLPPLRGGVPSRRLQGPKAWVTYSGLSAKQQQDFLSFFQSRLADVKTASKKH